MKYAFFPGCSLESTAWDFDKSTRAVCQALDIELEDIPDWVCCGSTPAHASNASLAIALPVMNLLRAREMGSSVVTACASCYARLRTANYKIQNDAEERERCQRVIGKPYDGSVEVRHIVDVLANDLGADAIRTKITHPLSGLKVASYYGCLLTRPPEVVSFEDPEHPTAMDDLLSAAGADAIDWPFKTECCGAGLSLTQPSVVNRLGHRLISMAREADARCIAVACPLCQMNLDLRQADSVRAHGQLPETPVLYITQLLGLALGLSPDELGIDALIVGASSLLADAGIGSAASRGGAV